MIPGIGDPAKHDDLYLSPASRTAFDMKFGIDLLGTFAHADKAEMALPATLPERFGIYANTVITNADGDCRRLV